MDYAYPKILENKHIRFALFYFISASQHYPNELLQKKEANLVLMGTRKNYLYSTQKCWCYVIDNDKIIQA